MIEGFTKVVMVGLVPTIQPSAGSDACGTLDPGDKPEDDTHVWQRAVLTFTAWTFSI
jgi:hypothetical protein